MTFSLKNRRGSGRGRSSRITAKKEGSKSRAKGNSKLLPGSPLILERADHSLSRSRIDEDALKVLYRLINHGYQAFLVGGSVRDIMLGKKPKDFDVGTNATVEEVRSVFRNSRIIGRRFRLTHVFFKGNKIIEVASFRGSVEESSSKNKTDNNAGALLKPDNVLGDPETDARRRDLTINGLFYDLQNFSIIDYVGGVEDLNKKIVRIIGEPDLRVKEDPVRIIRALRHKVRTDFTLESETYRAMVNYSHLIKECPPSRVYEELIRELNEGRAAGSVPLMHEIGLLEHLFPLLDVTLSGSPEGQVRLLEMLRRIDGVVEKEGEIPIHTLFPALIIGNVINGLRTYDEKLFSDDLIAAFWSALPQKISLEEAGQFDEFLGEGGLVKLVSKACRSIFHQIGVPRRAREVIEKAVYGRYILYTVYSERDNDKGLNKYLQKSYFDEALRLMEVTAVEEEMQECVKFWRTNASVFSKRKKKTGKV